MKKVVTVLNTVHLFTQLSYHAGPMSKLSVHHLPAHVTNFRIQYMH